MEGGFEISPDPSLRKRGFFTLLPLAIVRQGLSGGRGEDIGGGERNN